jgi:hypothetical protein
LNSLSQGGGALDKIEEKNLQQMEALLHHSARGVHILFDNKTIAGVLKKPSEANVFLDSEKLKKVQDILISLISKKSYTEKMDFLKDLDSSSLDMLVRTYFHIVENTIRSKSHQLH